MQKTLELNWTWRGWQEALENQSDGPWATLEAAALEKGVIDTQELETARVIYVDFFPDELDKQAWLRVAAYARKMVFLPPKVILPTTATNAGNKPVTWVDNEDSSLPNAEWMQQESTVAQLCQLPKIQAQTLSRLMEVKKVADHREISLSLGARVWILAVDSPHVEHALCLVAHQHGIRLAHWKRAYASPLRYLAGYRHPFDAVEDKSLREKIKRVMNLQQTGDDVYLEQDLEKVQAELSYEKLRLADPVASVEPAPGINLRQQILPAIFAKKLAEPHARAVINSAAAALLKRRSESAANALGRRVWLAMMTDIFSQTEAVAAQQWQRAFAADNEGCARATQELLKRAQSWELKAVVQRLLWALYELQTTVPAAQRLLTDIQALQPRWFDYPRIYPTLWEMRSMLEALTGKEPCKDTPESSQLYWALRRAAERKEELNGQELGAASDPALRMAMLMSFKTSERSFQAIFDEGRKRWGAQYAAEMAMRKNWGMGTDLNWQKENQPRLEMVLQALRNDENSQHRWREGIFYLSILSGKAEAACKEFQLLPAQEKKESLAMTMAFFCLTQRQPAMARELLKNCEPQRLTTALLQFYAMLAVASNMTERGERAFTLLKQTEPHFWLSSPLDADAAHKWMAAAIVGQTAGDDIMVKKALALLKNFPEEDKYTTAAHWPKGQTSEILSASVREWIMEAL